MFSTTRPRRSASSPAHAAGHRLDPVDVGLGRGVADHRAVGRHLVEAVQAHVRGAGDPDHGRGLAHVAARDEGQQAQARRERSERRAERFGHLGRVGVGDDGRDGAVDVAEEGGRPWLARSRPQRGGEQAGAVQDQAAGATLAVGVAAGPAGGLRRGVARFVHDSGQPTGKAEPASRLCSGRPCLACVSTLE